MQNYSPDHIKSNVQTYFRSFKEESIPDVKVGIDREIFNKQAQKPVQREQSWIHAMRFWKQKEVKKYLSFNMFRLFI